MASTSEFIDKYGFVKTKRAQDSTGNGLLYSVIAKLLFKRLQIPEPPLLRGMLIRTPENTYGQESHDNYFAAAIYYYVMENPRGARSLLWAMVIRFGYMKNVPYEKAAFTSIATWKDKVKWYLKIWMAPWMGRFPHVWIGMIAAAFPNAVVRKLSAMVLTLLASFSRLEIFDASGTQLTWLMLCYIRLLGTDRPMIQFLKEIDAKGLSVSKIQIANSYWDEDHFVLKGYDTYTSEVLSVIQK